MTDNRTDERWGIFDDHFFSKRHHIAWRAPAVVDAILAVVHPQTVLDVGCSIGEFVKEFNSRNIACLGMDLNDPKDYLLCDRSQFFKGDILQINKTIMDRWDLIMCVMMIQFIQKTDWPLAAEVFGRLVAPGGSVLTVTDATGFHNILIRKAPLKYNAEATREFRKLLEPFSKKTAIRAILNCGRFYDRIGE